MKNWYYINQLLRGTPSENMLFTGRVAFFVAGSSGSSGGAGGKSGSGDTEEEKKKPATPLDALTDNMGSKLLGSLNSTNSDDLLKKLKAMKETGKLSAGDFEKAKRLASGGTFSDRTLALRLAQGSVTTYRFNKIYNCLHLPQGDAHEQGVRKKLAEGELSGKISPSDFDTALSCLDSGSEKHQKAAEMFINDPKSAKVFHEFMKDSPLTEKKALSDLAGVSAFDSQEQRFRKSLTEFTGIEANDYINAKIDKPEDAQKVRAMIQEFGKESESHLDSWNQLSSSTKQSIAKGDSATEKAIDIMLSECFADAIRKSEKRIDITDLTRAMTAAQVKTGIDLSKLIPKNTLTQIEERLRFLQDIQAKIAKNYDQVTIKELGPRMEEVMKRVQLKQDIANASRQSGINLNPGTKIQYRMEVARDDGTIEHKWVTTEVQGVFLDQPSGEEVEWNGEKFKMENPPLVVVTGAGRETFGRFQKWVMDTQAHQVIDSTSELDREIQFDSMRLPIKEGMELEYETRKQNQGSMGTPFVTTQIDLAKIAKIHPNGFIELDHEVTLAHAFSGTVAGELLTRPIRKKTLTYGEFAQWIKRFQVVPHLKTGQQAEEAYNHWKSVHGNPGSAPVSFQKGGQLSYGPIEQKNALTVTNVTKEENHELVHINKVPYRPAQLLRTAMTANWRSNDPLTVATLATASIPAAYRAQARDEYAAKLQDELDELADMRELEDESHALHDAHAKGKGEDKAHGGKSAATSAETAEEKYKKAEEARQMANVAMPHEGTIAHIWNETQFLSCQDVGQLGKHIWEYWTRTWERKMKNRFAKFGSHLPFIGTEMLRIKEDTEHEEVEKFKHAMAHMGDFEVRGLLKKSSNQDQIKACIEVLVEKGMMRWDDVDFWKAVNRIPALALDKKIPIPKDGNPHSIVKVDSSGVKMTGMDMLKEAFENIWGDDNLYDKWKTSNKSAYKSGAEKYYNEAAALENDPYDNGGVTGRLKAMLRDHMSGVQVDPQQYEGFIKFIIKNGKSTAENKLYYIVMGVATNLLALERIGDLDSDHCNQMPWLDFFTQAKHEDKPVTLTTTQKDYPPHYGRPFSVRDFQVMANFFENDRDDLDKEKYSPGTRVKDFLWKKMLPHHTTQTRTSKGSRNAEQMDHDDAHFILPLLDYQTIINMCGSSAGDKKYFSVPGYLNGFPGFSEWMKTLAEEGNRDLLEKTILSYVNFDGIITNRYMLNDTKKQRVSDILLAGGTVVDGETPVNYHRNQIQSTILAIGRAAGKGRKWEALFDKVERSKDDPDGSKQKKIDSAIKDFGPELKEAIDTIGRERLFTIVRSANLKGYTGKPSDPALVRRLRARQAAGSEESSSGGGGDEL